MTAVAKIPEADVIEAGGGLAVVIERALANPNTGIDVLERLLSMQERIQARQAKHDFTAAKLAMRPELPEVTMKGHIIIKDKAGNITQDTPFAKFEDLHEAVMPVLTAHNFDLKFKTGMTPDGKPSVITILAHLNGHEEETEFVLPHDSSGSKNSVQAVGSSTSYGKRYGTLAILNIRVVGEDDDGEKASYKDTKGEPLARTKLDGPHESKSKLKAAIQAIRNKVHNCVDVKALNELLRAEKATIDQAARDWTSLLDGDPDIPEDHGLKGDVEIRRAQLKNNGGVYASLVGSMRQCETIATLNQWRIANEDAVDALDGPEARQFEREWDTRESEIALMDRSAS